MRCTYTTLLAFLSTHSTFHTPSLAFWHLSVKEEGCRKISAWSLRTFSTSAAVAQVVSPVASSWFSLNSIIISLRFGFSRLGERVSHLFSLLPFSRRSVLAAHRLCCCRCFRFVLDCPAMNGVRELKDYSGLGKAMKSSVSSAVLLR